MAASHSVFWYNICTYLLFINQVVYHIFDKSMQSGFFTVCRVMAAIMMLLVLTHPTIKAQKPAKIDLVHADRMQFDRQVGDNVRRLIDNVHFRHEDADMYCDSAYLFSDTNSIRAFGNVFIRMSDTVSIYGNVLYYNGNDRVAEMTGNVKMIDPQMTLTSRHLFYDRTNNTAWYNTGGTIVDAENELVSEVGIYYADLKNFFFRKDVVLTNPQYVMYADTLKYNTLTEVAEFFGPTTIVSEENTIFCRNGWYDTRNDIAHFSRDAWFTNGEQSLTGDTLFYDRNLGYGRALMNIELRDSVQNTIITGHFAEHFEKEGLSIVTNEALLIHFDKGDSLFLHADTLRSIVDPENDNEPRWVYAYNRVRFFRSDLQGLCDSLVYNFTDSIINMYVDPVLWTDVHQLTAQRIELKTSDEQMETIELFEAAFIVSEEEELGFNQVKGRNMKGYFHDNELYRIDVFGNGETLYFVREEDGAMVGLNKALATEIVIFIEDRQVAGLRFKERPDANLIPPEEITDEDKLLRNFQWLDGRRPKNREDIFVWK